MKNQQAETGVNVCDRTIRNQLNERGLTDRYAKCKPALTPKQKKKGYSRLMKSSQGVWMIWWKWYLLKNQESAMATELMLQLLLGLPARWRTGETEVITSTIRHRRRLEFWTLSSFHQSEVGLVIMSYFRIIFMHLDTEQRVFKLFFRKCTSAHWHGQQTFSISSEIWRSESPSQSKWNFIVATVICQLLYNNI